MRVTEKTFIEFAYGDKRRDKAKVESILGELDVPYDPARDRYKRFREALKSFESRQITEQSFLDLHSRVSANKSAGYKVLFENYLELKEDHAFLWHGKSPIQAEFDGLTVTTSWYLRTESNNQQRIIYLNFGKDPLPFKKEKGLRTLLRLAAPDSAGVGILNIQAGTLITANRLDQAEANYLRQRANKFVTLAHSLQHR